MPMGLVQPSITIPPLSVSDGPVPSCAGRRCLGSCLSLGCII